MASYSLEFKGMHCPNIFGITKIDCLDRKLQQALAAEALVGILLGNRGANRRSEYPTCTLTLSRVLVLTDKRSTTARTRFVFVQYIISISSAFTRIAEYAFLYQVLDITQGSGR